MTNPYDSATPEQKLWMLRSEIIAPTILIAGWAKVTQKDIEANSITPDEILKRLNTIEESAKKIKDLLDQMADTLRANWE